MYIDQSADMADFCFVSKYSKYLPNKKRRETWNETIDRGEQMFREKYPQEEVQPVIDFVFKHYRNKDILASQRNLQFAGPAVFHHNARSYNCAGSYCDRLRFFQEAVYLLLCGTGVGASVQKHHIAKLPNLLSTQDKGEKLHVVDDSIEGWANAFGILISSYFENSEFPEFEGYRVVFDYSKIRPQGSDFSHGIGKAPGSDGLRTSLEKVREILNGCLKARLKKIRPIHAYDIIMHSADAVLSGGIRRSACIIAFSYDDEEMMRAKTGDWMTTNPQRARSNNTCILLRNSISREQFEEFKKFTKEFGEPGFAWVDSLEIIFNPCLTENNYVETINGYKRISDLIGKSFQIKINNKTFDCKNGFYETGYLPTIKLVFKNGYSLECTSNHLIETTKGWFTAFKIAFGRKEFDVILGDGEVTQIRKVIDKGYQTVYDCTIDSEEHKFICNGISVHNCLEIGFYCYDEFGNSGWQLCNLSTVNGSHINSLEDFITFGRAAASVGTLQAGFDKFPYLGEVSERIIQKEALIGVSITGMMTRPDILFNPEYQQIVAEEIKKTNKEVAELIGINQAARCTAIKPEGSSTTMLGLVSFAGCHAGKGRKVLRRIQMNKTEAPAIFYKNYNHRAVEESVWSPNKTDDTVTFCCLSPEGSIQESDMTALEFLEKVLSTKINWVDAGTNIELCSLPTLRNNVSNTVKVRDNEWDDVWNFIYENRNNFMGISFISDTGDKDYPQAPFCEVFDSSEIVEKYGECSLFTSGLIESGIREFKDLWLACSTLLGYGESLTAQDLRLRIRGNKEYWAKQQLHVNVSEEKLEEWLQENVNNLSGKRYWVDRAKSFSNKYMDGDLKRFTYLLKDVHNWKLWQDITLEHIKLDYTKMIEETNNTKGTQEIACAGGQCLI